MSLDGTAAKVREAEWAIRRKQPRALVKAASNELWTFSLDGEQPCGPNEAFGLKETSTGVFHVTTIAATETLPTPYRPLIDAVRSLISHALIETGKYLPFGQLLLAPGASRIVHLDPHFASAQGELVVEAYAERTDFVSLTAASGSGRQPLPEDDVYVLPSGEAVKYIGAASAPRNVDTFVALIEQYVSQGCLDAEVDLGQWIKVRSSGGREVVWPAGLCYWHQASVPVVKDDWFAAPDLFGELETQVNALKTSESVATAAGSTGPSASAPAGPAAAAASPAVSRAPVQSTAQNNIEKTQGQVYPTPPDPQKRSEAKPEPQNWITPVGTTEAWGDLDDDLFGDEQVTEADFNFFDQPEQAIPPAEDAIMYDVVDSGRVDEPSGVQAAPTAAQEAPVDKKPIPKIEEPIEPVEPVGEEAANMPEPTQELDRPPLDADVELVSEQPPAKRRRSVYSPLAFNPVISKSLDAKYATGGRFFSSLPAFEESDSSDGESTTGGGTPRTRSRSHSALTPPGRSVSEMRAATAEAETAAENEASVAAWTEMVSKWGQIKAVPLAAPVMAAATSVNNEESDPATASTTRALLRSVMEQVVWDNGVFGSVTSSAATTPREVPDDVVVQRLGSLFPQFRPLSLYDIVQLSDTGGAPNASTPQPEGGDGGEQTSKIDDPSVAALAALKARNSPSLGYPDEASPTSGGWQTGAGGQQPPAQNQIRGHAEKNATEIVSLPPPMYAVMRMNQRQKARSPILRFWRMFGLRPQHGPKNLAVVTLCPGSPGVVSAVSSFVAFLKSTYEESGLGTFDTTIAGDADGGIFTFANEPSDFSFASLTKCYAKVVAALEKAQPTTNVLALAFDPYAGPSSPSSLLTFSRAYASAAETLDRSSTSKIKSRDLFWQLMPVSAVTANGAVVMPSQYHVVLLALGLYDKCPPTREQAEAAATAHSRNRTGSPQSPPPASNFDTPPFTVDLREAGHILTRRYPAFALARYGALKIPFRLTPTAPADLLDEDSLLHVAYSVSPDRRWATAAWTDQWGEIANVEAFPLGRDPSVTTLACEELCRKIWFRTLQIATVLPIQWRVVIAKSDTVDDDELSTWIRLSEDRPSARVSHVYVLSVERGGPVSVRGDSSAVFPHHEHKPAPAAAASPASRLTPGQGATAMESPDAYGSGFTPGPTASTPVPGPDDSKDEETLVVDARDDSYGVVFRSWKRLNQVSSHLKNAPLVSGLLIQPPLQPGDEHIHLELSLVHSPSPPMGMMKCLLPQYRRLASLGQYTGVSTRETSVLPWHIEAAAKMMRFCLSRGLNLDVLTRS